MPLLYWFSMQPEAEKYKSILSTYKSALSKYKSIRSKYKAYFQSTKVYFQSTKVYFQSTKAYFQSTKVYFQKYKSMLSRSTRIYFQSTKVYFQSIYTSILSKYKSALPKHKVSLGTESPEPGTFLIPRVSGTGSGVQTSKPRARNLLNPEPWRPEPGFLEPQNLSEPIETRTQFPELVPRIGRPATQNGSGTGSRNPVPSRNPPARPEHTEIYIVQRPQSILLLRKKIWNCTGKHVYARWIIRIFMPYLPLKVVWISKSVRFSSETYHAVSDAEKTW